jgi:hypothetical protein
VGELRAVPRRARDGVPRHVRLRDRDRGDVRDEPGDELRVCAARLRWVHLLGTDGWRGVCSGCARLCFVFHLQCALSFFGAKHFRFYRAVEGRSASGKDGAGLERTAVGKSWEATSAAKQPKRPRHPMPLSMSASGGPVNTHPTHRGRRRAWGSASLFGDRKACYCG